MRRSKMQRLQVAPIRKSKCLRLLALLLDGFGAGDSRCRGGFLERRWIEQAHG
jgi:hypothetical protein